MLIVVHIVSHNTFYLSNLQQNAKLLVDVTYSAPTDEKAETPPFKSIIRKKSMVSVSSIPGESVKWTLPIDDSEGTEV